MKQIRLIELFAGIGSQAMGLRDIGADFQHYRVIEYDKFCIAVYNAIHCTDFKPMDITKTTGSDLGIVDTDKYTYLLTYSFPCVDLSPAGKGKGMSKGTGTRSGLLWEVERLLNEVENLPQILVMENVPQVHGKKNMHDFRMWLDFLSSKGYKTKWKDLNAKDYGIPQSRKRCFAVSILGNNDFKFPEPVPLEKRMKDYLEDEVDEKYYLTSDKAKELIDKLVLNGKIPASDSKTIGAVVYNLSSSNKDRTPDGHSSDVAATLMARDFKGLGNYGSNCAIGVNLLGTMPGYEVTNRVYDSNAISPTIRTYQGGGLQPKIVETKCVGGIGEKKSNGDTQYYQQDRVYYGDIALAHTANMPGGSYRYVTADQIIYDDVPSVFERFTYLIDGIVYLIRIRRLMPREVWRLMGFSDDDFDKAANVVSSSQLYKQAGNSIVKQVLMSLFRNLIDGVTEESEEDEWQQLSLL